MLQCTLSKTGAQDLWTSFTRGLEALNTPNDVIKTLRWGLFRWCADLPQLEPDADTVRDNPHIAACGHDQSEIGWDHAMRGRLGYAWQDAYYHATEREGRQPKDNWSAKVIQLINALTASAWERRCRAVYGDDKATAREAKRQQLTAQVKLLARKHREARGNYKTFLWKGLFCSEWDDRKLRAWLQRSKHVVRQVDLTNDDLTANMRPITAYFARQIH